MVRHVRFGPLFVWHNPVGENKSPLKSTTSETSFPASQIPYSALRFVGVRFAAPFRLAFSDPLKSRLAYLHRWQAKKKGDQKMRYLIEMKLSSSMRSKVPQDGIFLIEQYISPSLEICRKWQADGKLLAGGPVSGSIQLAIVLEVESVQELDELIEGLPLWPLMETSVIPLTTFEGRIAAVQSKLKQLRSLIQEPSSEVEAATRR